MKRKSKRRKKLTSAGRLGSLNRAATGIFEPSEDPNNIPVTKSSARAELAIDKVEHELERGDSGASEGTKDSAAPKATKRSRRF